MWEVKFHPSHPDNLFTCSDDGSVWHWDASAGNVTSQTMSMGGVSSAARGDFVKACLMQARRILIAV